MRAILLSVCFLGAFLAGAQPGDDTHGITLQRIMSDPEWIGLFPQRAGWSDDGETILFYRERLGEDLEDLVELAPDTGAERVLTEAERAERSPVTWTWSRDGSRRLATRSGDIFLWEVGEPAPVQLTRTTDRESSAMFLRDAQSIAYRTGGAWHIHNTRDGSVRQVADIRFEDEPKHDDKEDGYLDEQQERLFETIAARKEREKARREQREQIEEASPIAVPGPFYLGKGLERRREALSDDGRYIAIVVSKPMNDAERDTMPAYVTEDGYVSTSRVRTKVGVQTSENERLFLVDTRDETWVEVSLEDLPGRGQDPLAFLRKAEDEGSDEEDGSEGEEQPENEDEAEEEKESESNIRSVSIQSLDFRPQSHELMIQVRSHDHKDRWLAVVRPAEEEPAVDAVFQESTDGWINWRSTAGDWMDDGSQYWFLSEISGFSHVHTWDDSGVRQVTRGEYEVWDIQESRDPMVLYGRTNQTHPSVYELARISLENNSIERLTDLKSVVERFRVSPEGDRVLLEVSTNDHPSELFLLDLESGEPAKRLTHSVSDEFTRLPWIEPEYVEIESAGGIIVPARIYRSEQSPGMLSRRPAVIFVHGAGYTQNIDRGWPYYFREMMFHSLLAYKGYVVADIDFRASAGYGREFREAIYRNMGGPEIEDMVSVARWLVENEDVDPGRIGTYGGSYGGFLAIMSVFKEPGVFHAAAALRPVTDWAHYNHGYTSNILNTPEVDPEAYERSSPIEYAENFEGGLLICHGMLDDNVLVQDTIRLQQRLIELEKEDWEVALYPLEGHGFVEPSAWLDEYRRIFKLFETRLRQPLIERD